MHRQCLGPPSPQLRLPSLSSSAARTVDPSRAQAFTDARAGCRRDETEAQQKKNHTGALAGACAKPRPNLWHSWRHAAEACVDAVLPRVPASVYAIYVCASILFRPSLRLLLQRFAFSLSLSRSSISGCRAYTCYLLNAPPPPFIFSFAFRDSAQVCVFSPPLCFPVPCEGGASLLLSFPRSLAPHAVQ